MPTKGLLFLMMVAVMPQLSNGEEAVAEPAKDPPAKVTAKLVEMDEAARKILDAWEKKLYQPGRAGVKQAAVSIQATVQHPKFPKPLQATGQFRWDARAAESGRLAWDNEVAGALLMEQGWNAQNLSEPFDPEHFRKSLAGAKLIARTDDEKTVLTVAGPTAGGFKEFVFDREGLLAESVMAVPGPGGAEGELRFKNVYRKEGEQYLFAGWNYTFEPLGQGKLESTVKITQAQVGAYWVWSKVEESVSLDGKVIGSTLLEFSGQRFNAEAGE